MTKSLKALILSSVFTFGLATALPVAHAEELSLDQAVARGVATNPEYGVVANNRMATQEELEQGEGLYLPSVDMRATTGLEWNDDRNNRSRGESSATYGTYDYGITLTQMLFDGFAAKNEVERQEARVRSAANRVDEVSHLVGLNIVSSYLEVMRQRDLLKITKDNVQEHLSMLNEIRSGAMAGRSTEADVAQAEARLAAARANEANVREALRVAEANFIRHTGDKPGILVMPEIPFEALQENVDEAVKIAVTETPTLGIFEADADVAWQEYEATQSNFYPRVDLQLGGRQTNDIGGAEGNDQSATAQIVARWNVFRGGIDTHLRREHVYRHAQAKERRALEARRIENDVRQTWAAMVASGERAKQFDEQASANMNVVSAYKDQFELDRRTLLDVLDAQNELFVSRSNAVNAQYLEMLAVYRILALQGRLLSTMGLPDMREAALVNKVQ